jgi:thiamine pyrophosphate-dependent acetolactate synthase large subunit-like protein
VAHLGDLLSELLVRYGVSHVFGQPGGQTAALYDGIASRADRIKHVLVRDERSAAYAADAFARLTGRPGICDVTVGPGTTKLADESLGWLAIWQKLFFEGLRESVDLENEAGGQDFAAVARGLGCEGIRVERPDQLGDALDAAFASSKPVVVDVRTDPLSTPVHSYRRRLAEGKSYPRPGTVYELVPWRRSASLPPDRD